MLSVLIMLRLLRDKRIEGMIIRKEIYRSSAFITVFFPLFFLENVVAITDADLAFDTTSSLLLL